MTSESLEDKVHGVCHTHGIGKFRIRILSPGAIILPSGTLSSLAHESMLSWPVRQDSDVSWTEWAGGEGLMDAWSLLRRTLGILSHCKLTPGKICYSFNQ